LSSNVVISSTGSEITNSESFQMLDFQRDAHAPQKPLAAGRSPIAGRSLCLVEERVSSWSQSGLKRLFDVACVVLALPVVVPVLLIVGLAVRLTSKGPVLFLQTRTGLRRKCFTILKFRTMEHTENGVRHKVTTEGNQRFTPVGPFLRRWKLDELPQVLNVLIGDMSLVGPRPKLAEHQLGELRCRPGITGAATITFAQEEQVLARLPHREVDDYYHSIVLPAKLQLDRVYTARSTFVSDLKMIADTILRRWDSRVMCQLLKVDPIELRSRGPRLNTLASSSTSVAMTSDESLASGD
jgi:lipopolysaccharide/colanic/teichoic acid biosynthesis glycosyltransferase